jgi:hypothetical protein
VSAKEDLEEELEEMGSQLEDLTGETEERASPPRRSKPNQRVRSG